MNVREFFSAMFEHKFASVLAFILIVGTGTGALWYWYNQTEAVPEGSIDPAWTTFKIGIVALVVITLAILYIVLPKPYIWWTRNHPLLTTEMVAKKRKEAVKDISVDVIKGVLMSLFIAVLLGMVLPAGKYLQFEQLADFNMPILKIAGILIGSVTFVLTLYFYLRAVIKNRKNYAQHATRHLNAILRKQGGQELIHYQEGVIVNEKRARWVGPREFASYQLTRSATISKREGNKPAKQGEPSSTEVEQEWKNPAHGTANELFSKVGPVTEYTEGLDVKILKLSAMVLPLIAVGVLVNLGMPFPRWGWLAAFAVSLVIGALLFWIKIKEVLLKLRGIITSIVIVMMVAAVIFLIKGGGSFSLPASFFTDPTPTASPTPQVINVQTVTESGTSLSWDANIFGQEIASRAIAELESPVNHLNTWVAVINANEEIVLLQDRDLLNVAGMLTSEPGSVKTFCYEMYDWVYRGLPGIPNLETSYLERISAQAAMADLPQANPLIAASKDLVIACDSLISMLEELDQVHQHMESVAFNYDNADQNMIQMRWGFAEDYQYQFNDAVASVNRRLIEVGSNVTLNTVDTLITTLRSALSPAEKEVMVTPTPPQESHQVNPTATLAAVAETTAQVPPAYVSPILPEGCTMPPEYTNISYLGSSQNLWSIFEFITIVPTTYVGNIPGCGHVYVYQVVDNIGTITVLEPGINVDPGARIIGALSDTAYQLWLVDDSNTPIQLLLEYKK